MGQTALYGIPSIVGRLLNYLLVFIHSRIFHPAEYGMFSELYAYSAFIFVFLTFGMETAFFRYATKQKEITKSSITAFLPIAAVCLIFITVVTLFLSNISESIGFESNNNYVHWIAIIATFDVLSAIPFALLRLQNKAKRFGIIKISNIAINIGLNLILLLLLPWLAQNGVPHLSAFDPPNVGFIIIANLAASGATLLMLLPQFKFISLFRKFDKKLFKEMILYALPLLVMGLAGIANEILDRILLRWWTVTPSGFEAEIYVRAQQGIYSANYKLAILMSIFIQAFRYAAEPFFFSLSDEKNSKKSYADIAKFFTIFCSLIFLGVMLYIDLFKLFIGEQYRAGVGIVPIVLLANLFLGLIYNLSIWYKLTNKTYYGAILAIVGASITLLVNYILIPEIGYMGAAWATFACYLSMLLLSYFLGQKHYPVPYDIKSILLYLSYALLIFYISTFVEDFHLVLKLFLNTILILTFMGTVIYKERLHVLIKQKIVKRRE